MTLCQRLGLLIVGVTVLAAWPTTTSAQTEAILKLLKSGKVPAARQGNYVKVICARGDDAALGYVLEQTAAEEGFQGEVLEIAVEGLAEAAQARKVIPAADPALVNGLLTSEQPVVQAAAIRLAEAWGAPEFAPGLIALAETDGVASRLREQAIRALAATGTPAAAEALQRWMTQGATQPSLSVSAARGYYLMNPDEHGSAVVAWLVEQPVEVDFAPVVQAMLNQQTGASQLARLLTDVELSADQAKRVLRAVYAVGRSDSDLVNVLADKAGLNQQPIELTPAMMADLVAQVQQHGDPVRGEAVFRRADLTCRNCHAISGAGGKIGPDLSAVGASSPADYLINAIVKPEQDVKEMYRMVRVQTIDGQLLSGVVAKEDDETLILRDAAGVEHIVPQIDIEDSVEGGSLMPKGLKALMTEQEFLDLIAFLDEVGQPGPFAVRATPTIQRWKVAGAADLGVAADELEKRSGIETLSKTSLDTIPSLYARVAGELPWDEVRNLVRDDWAVLQAEVEVVNPGTLTLEVRGPQPHTVWVDDQRWEDLAEPLEFTEGTHRVVFIFAPDTQADGVWAEFQRPAGSSIDMTVVGGP